MNDITKLKSVYKGHPYYQVRFQMDWGSKILQNPPSREATTLIRATFLKSF